MTTAKKVLFISLLASVSLAAFFVINDAVKRKKYKVVKDRSFEILIQK